MLPHSISSLTSPNIHFLVAIFVSLKKAKVAFIPSPLHTSLFRLSSLFDPGPVPGPGPVLDLSTAFFSVVCSALYCLQLINICSGVCFTLHIQHKLFSYAGNLTRYDLKYPCASLCHGTRPLVPWSRTCLFRVSTTALIFRFASP